MNPTGCLQEQADKDLCKKRLRHMFESVNENICYKYITDLVCCVFTS